MAAPTTRVPGSFVHLDVRSCFSLKEGAFTPEQLAARAAGLGMPAVAISDRDGLYGAARFVPACADAGVKPILGASLTVRAPQPRGRGSERDTHVVLLAQDDTGYANLCRLITDAHMLGERGDPWVVPRRSARTRPGWSRSLGPRSHAGRRRDRGRADAAARLLAPFREAFGPSGLRGAWSTGWSADRTTRSARCCGWPSGSSVRAVATNPVRYLVPEDAFVADALECMRQHRADRASTTSPAATPRAG